MSRIKPIIKREFTEAVGTRAFVIGTIIGPLLIFGLFGLEFLVMAKGGAGNQHIAILDASGLGIGAEVETAITRRSELPSFISRPTFDLDVETASGDIATVTKAKSQAVVDKKLDGWMWIPADVMTGGKLEYEGSNATNQQVTNELQNAVQDIVQSARLRAEGIDTARMEAALREVPIDVAKTGEKGELGNPAAAMGIAFAMAFAIYIVVIIYGQSIMSSVMEEKRDRIVELIVSSVRARDLLVGKVIGIGGAGVLQMLIWVAAGALLVTQGALIAGAMGANADAVDALTSGNMIPHVPLSIGVIFVLFFAGGFLLFATLFAIIGAIVTEAKEAQQFVFPVLMPFVLGLFVAMTAAQNPSSPVAIAGSLIPFTAAMVMPVRAMVGGIDWPMILLSLGILYGTAFGVIWIAAKIYRVAIFATGQKPTARELVRWMRAA
jgi:ABC-2 type transport system permease protein